MNTFVTQRRGWYVAGLTLLLALLWTGTVWAQTGSGSTYIARGADTYHAIASRHGITIQQLADLNPGISVYSRPFYGQSLRVPTAALIGPVPRYCPKLHIVNPNETLQWLGGAYGVPVSELASLNNMYVHTPLYPGYVLCLPAYAELRAQPAVGVLASVLAPAPALPAVSVRLGVPSLPSAVPAPASVPAGPWTGYYFNYLHSASHALQRQDAHINFHWGTRSPGPNVGADHFSVVWLGRHTFSGQNYRFVALADDGVRVWVGNTLVIDGWTDQSVTLYYKDYAPSRGTHDVRVEYFDSGITAQISVNWAPN